MTFEDFVIFRTERFTIGQEAVTKRYFLSFPVSNGLVEYSEYYELTPEEFERFWHGLDGMRRLVAECRERLHDDRLMVKPGSKRGYAN